MKTQIANGDIFEARYVDYKKDNHCFEGLLIAKNVDDKIILFDTFWGIGDTSGKSFKLNDDTISIEFICNFDEIEPCQLGAKTKLYYKPIDVVYLHRQHACTDGCKYYYIKKGAVRDKATMLESASIKSDDIQRRIASLHQDLEWNDNEIAKINNGELDNIYL